MTQYIEANTFYSNDELDALTISTCKNLGLDANSNTSIIDQASPRYAGGSNGLQEAQTLQYHLDYKHIPKADRYVACEDDYEVCIWDESNYESIDEAIRCSANYELRTGIPLSCSEDIIRLLNTSESCIRMHVSTQIAVKTIKNQWLPMAIALIKD